MISLKFFLELPPKWLANRALSGGEQKRRKCQRCRAYMHHHPGNSFHLRCNYPGHTVWDLDMLTSGTNVPLHDLTWRRRYTHNGSNSPCSHTNNHILIHCCYRTSFLLPAVSTGGWRSRRNYNLLWRSSCRQCGHGREGSGLPDKKAQ